MDYRAAVQADRDKANPTPQEQDAALARQQKARWTYLSTGGVFWVAILGMLHRDHGTGVIFYVGVAVAVAIVATILLQLACFGHRRRMLRSALARE